MRRRLRTALLSLGLLAAAAAAPAQPQAGAPPSVEAFFGKSDVQHVRLSPSGRWLAIGTLAGGENYKLVITDTQDWGRVVGSIGFGRHSVGTFHWVDDDRLIVSGLADRDADPGLLVLDRVSGRMREIIRTSWYSEGSTGSNTRMREPLDPSHRLLHVPDDGSGEIIVGHDRFEQGGDWSRVNAKRVNVATGRDRTLTLGAPDNVRHWLFDAKGEPRAVEAGSGARRAVYVRDLQAQSWRRVAEYPLANPPYRLHSTDADGTIYVVRRDPGSGFEVLTVLDPATGEPRAEALVSAPGFDFRGELVSETPGGRTLGVRADLDGEITFWMDPRLKALQEEVDRRFPGRLTRMSCRRCDAPDMVALVYAWSDRDPGSYAVYFAKDKRWMPVGQVRRQIDPARMGRMSFERVRARDGLEFPVWVTRPAGAPAAAPAVVLVHGGPWVRGRVLEWDRDTQFLASRGYVVIEPEFRGSTGYGWKLHQAGWRQWGQAMQDDVADAVAWAAGEGWIDPKRVCIAGASYGGYATLMGLVRHPEAYRCGVAWAAVSDLRLMHKWFYGTDVSEDWRRHGDTRLVGDPVVDAEMLRIHSPVEQAAKIRAPLLLAHGQPDPRVSVEHARTMRDALEKAGNPPEWVIYAREGHGWFDFENQVDFWKRVERFLARHLKN